jgi:molecular chaperone DnaJ
MATTERDYYELLGVSRTADERAIKRAFRQKARELHPDVSEAPDAEEEFRQVVEAYEVLSKSETRNLYDRYGHAGLRTGGFRPTQFDFGDLSDLFSAFFGDDLFGVARQDRRRGGDIAAEIEIELLDAAKGVKREVRFPVSASCETCGGDGVAPGTEALICSVCGGAGRVSEVRESAFGQFIRAVGCRACGGAGRIVEHPCERCGGSGRVVEERMLEVEVPPGIHDGQRIRISGEGHAGARGGRAGDMYVHVHVRPDARFAREGNDIFSSADVTMAQAALGATVTIPTLDGDVELDVSPGTQPGEVRILRGRGMPVLQGFGRGDHRVLINVLVPRRLTVEQRRALEELDRTLDAESYRDDEGFFDKLKSAFR